MPDPSIVYDKYILQIIIVVIAEFEQINGRWSWETTVSDNKFSDNKVFSNCGMYNVLWAGKI